MQNPTCYPDGGQEVVVCVRNADLPLKTANLLLKISQNLPPLSLNDFITNSHTKTSNQGASLQQLPIILMARIFGSSCGAQSAFGNDLKAVFFQTNRNLHILVFVQVFSCKFRTVYTKSVKTHYSVLRLNSKRLK